MSDAITRRELLRRGSDIGGLLAAPLLLRAHQAEASTVRSARVAPGELRPGPDVYESIGVGPLINGRGTYTTVISRLLPADECGR